MTFSLRSMLNYKTYEGHLWSIWFQGNTPMNAGGGIGIELPSTSVDEKLYTVDYDTLTIANSFDIKVPQNVSYLGELSITFVEGYNNQIMEITNYFKEWVTQIHENNTFKDLSEITRYVMVKKFSRDSDKFIKSYYQVLPPEDLNFTPSGDVDIYTSTVTFPIVATMQLND